MKNLILFYLGKAILWTCVWWNVHFIKDVNYRDSNGYTALILAVLNDDLRMVRYLIEFGANKRTRGPNNFTAIEIAKELKRNKILEYLENS